MIGATDIFVSYKAEDRARLLPLVSALEAEGFTVWWDTHIGGGAHWREDIQEHLDAAKCVIVVWSRRSVGPEGDFVRDEATRARKRGTYLPVRLDAIEPPLGFGEVQAISLKGWKGDRSDAHFRAVAEAVARRIAGEDIAHVTLAHDRPGASRRAVIASGIGICAVALAGVGGWLLFKPEPTNTKRIAVLPFANLSNDPAQAYFSEGIAEELRSALSRIGLEVIGRSSSEAVKDLETKAAASRLGVAHILTGSVRRSPQMIRINAQLVSGSDGVQRWAQSYDRAPGDAIKIQSDIAANVAQALSIALGQVGRAALMLGGTSDSVAQDLVLQSRRLFREAEGREALSQSVALAERAIARDRNYADAYIAKTYALSGIAQNYPSTPAEAVTQLDEADSAVKRALALAPRLGTAHAALSYLDSSRLKLRSSLRHIRQALALSPEDPDVLRDAAITISYLGDLREALRLADRLVELDPLNASSYRRKSDILLWMRRYPEAIEAGRKALAITPELFTVHINIGDSFLLLGRVSEATAEFGAMPIDDPFRLTREAIVAARTGDTALATRKTAKLEQLLGAAASYQYAEIHAQLQDRKRAFAELDNALKVQDPGLIYLRVDPFLDPIRNDPRYAALVKKLNFP